MRESAIEEKGNKALRADGYEVMKLGRNGIPDDIVLLSNWRHIFIEWKQPGAPLTPAQLRRIPKLRARGELVAVWDDHKTVVELVHSVEASINLGFSPRRIIAAHPAFSAL